MVVATAAILALVASDLSSGGGSHSGGSYAGSDGGGSGINAPVVFNTPVAETPEPEPEPLGVPAFQFAQVPDGWSVSYEDGAVSGADATIGDAYYIIQLVELTEDPYEDLDAYVDDAMEQLSSSVVAGTQTARQHGTVGVGGYEAIYTSAYYESDGFPAHIVLDLGAVYEVHVIALNLPNSLMWNARTQKIAFSGSAQDIPYGNDVKFDTFLEEQDYLFDPQQGNKVTIELAEPVRMRYLRLDISANDIAGGYGAQLSEIYVFGSN